MAQDTAYPYGPSSGTVRTYLPESFAPDELPSRWRAYGAWVVHHLYLSHHINSRYTDSEFIPLFSKTLEKILPKREYRDILNCLIDIPVIETDDTYSVGYGGRPGRSKGFRLAEPHRESKFRLRHFDHPELAGKLARRRDQQAKAFLPVHRHLNAQLTGLEVAGVVPTDDLPLVTIANRDFWFVVCRRGGCTQTSPT